MFFIPVKTGVEVAPYPFPGEGTFRADALFFGPELWRVMGHFPIDLARGYLQVQEFMFADKPGDLYGGIGMIEQLVQIDVCCAIGDIRIYARQRAVINVPAGKLV